MLTRMLSTKTSITGHSFGCAHIVWDGDWPFGKLPLLAESVGGLQLVARNPLGWPDGVLLGFSSRLHCLSGRRRCLGGRLGYRFFCYKSSLLGGSGLGRRRRRRFPAPLTGIGERRTGLG